MSDRADADARTAERLPHFRAAPTSPRLDDGALGIALATDGVVASRDARTWPLRGVVRIALPEGLDRPVDVLRRIAIVMTPEADRVSQPHRVAADAVLFDDDVVAGERVTAHFNVDVLRAFRPVARRDRYHFVAAIGAHTSDVVSVDVELPWLDEGAGAAADAADEDAADAAADDEPADDADDGDEEADDPGWEVDDPA
ncbi:MAG: hypothetical protein R3E88_15955 [Myxococcota bacterium]